MSVARGERAFSCVHIGGQGALAPARLSLARCRAPLTPLRSIAHTGARVRVRERTLSLRSLFNQAEQVVREACMRLPLLGERGHDIRSQTNEIGAGMLADLQPDATVFGIVVQRIVIVEARYSPEIAQQMLMKQQAGAMVAARKEIVAGALNVVRDTLAEFPRLSQDARERMISNLLVTLTAHQPAVPVLALA